MVSTFDNLVSAIAHRVIGCPSAIIASALENTAKAYFERSHAWVDPQVSVQLQPSIYKYTIASSFGQQASVSAVVQDSVYVNGTNLAYVTLSQLKAAYPSFPNNTSGVPSVVAAEVALNSPVIDIYVCPVPEDAYTLTLDLALVPTEQYIPPGVLNANQVGLEHGVLHNLHMLPGAKWFDKDVAAYHGKMFSYYTNLARAKRFTGNGPAVRTAVTRPFA